MIYSLSLRAAALGAGLLLVLVAAFALTRGAAARAAAPGLARRSGLGTLLLAAALAWTLWLLNGALDLGEFSHLRGALRAGAVLLAAGTAIFLRDLLLPRALGILLLLGADVLVCAAFPDERPVRLAVTVTGYAWAVAGMVLVAWPYRLRDWLAWAAAGPGRWRGAFGALGATGLLLAGLGWLVY